MYYAQKSITEGTKQKTENTENTENTDQYKRTKSQYLGPVDVPNGNEVTDIGCTIF